MNFTKLPALKKTLAAQFLIGLAAAMIVAPRASAQTGGFRTLATADFDGDHFPDFVTASSSRTSATGSQYTVEIKLSAQTNRISFSFLTHSGGLDLTARDVDGDGDLDLIVTARLSGDHVGIWINDGAGGLSRGKDNDYPSWVWEHGSQLRSGLSPQVSVAGLADNVQHPALLRDQTVALSSAGSGIAANPLRTQLAEFGGANRIRPPPQKL